jgi:hypothetical protein
VLALGFLALAVGVLLADARAAGAYELSIYTATPLGFWASLPKRHSVTALVVVCVCYTLYRSREAESAIIARRFRALTYAWVGPITWVHAPEGFVLLVANTYFWVNSSIRSIAVSQVSRPIARDVSQTAYCHHHSWISSGYLSEVV